jgi:hypothetical protein
MAEIATKVGTFCGAGLKKECSKHTRHRECHGNSKDESDGDREHALTQNHDHQTPSICTEDHAEADLVGSLSDRIVLRDEFTNPSPAYSFAGSTSENSVASLTIS